MLDEKDLQAIAEIMDSKIGASEKRMAQLMAQQRRDIMQDVKALLDTEVQTKFNLLAEGQQAIMEALTPKSEIEQLRSEMDVLKLAVRTLSQDLDELKKAQ